MADHTGDALLFRVRHDAQGEYRTRPAVSDERRAMGPRLTGPQCRADSVALVSPVCRRLFSATAGRTAFDIVDVAFAPNGLVYGSFVDNATGELVVGHLTPQRRSRQSAQD